MLGNFPLGLSALGASTIFATKENLSPPRIHILGNDCHVELHVDRDVANTPSIKIRGNPADVLVTAGIPSIEDYKNVITSVVRRPVYKIEFLRQEDETPYFDLTGDVICDSGSISIEKQNGVRRTSSFELSNIGSKYMSFVENLTIGSKYRVSIGEEIDGKEFFLRKGTFLFDNPSISGGLSDRKVTISGTDKWSVLNGQHGGILEGTYTVEAGSKLGDFIRRTLRINVVNDPIEPMIHSKLEDVEITYDITKSEGSTIADVFLDIALNTNSDIFYDEFGRLNVVPLDETENRAVVKRFAPDDYSYISASKTYNNDKVYNSVLVTGENVQNTNTPVRYELENLDLDDPNSVPNVGVKKVYKVSEYTSGIDTEEKARQRAVYELRNIRERSSSVGIEYVDIIYLDVDQIVELEDETISSEPERYVVTSLSHNIGVNLSVSASISKINY